MERKSLCGKWSLSDKNRRYTLDAAVPGCNYLDLLSAKRIPDPFIGTNEKDVYWVAKTDWEYARSFTLTEKELANEHIDLVCKRLDTICDVFINGSKVGSGNNCHVAYTFDVKNAVRSGENEIKIFFRSPVEYVSEKYKSDRTPANNNGQNGIVHIRKPQCHFGWDWGPVLPPSGIGGDIYIEMRNEGKIFDLFVTQKKNADGSFTVTAKAEAELSDKQKMKITLLCPNGEKMTAEGTSAEFSVEKPELWWTADLSDKKEQPLYTVRAAITEGRKKIDSAEKKIGLREIKLNREKDEYGQNFQFVINGVPLFIKGTNFIPADSFVTRFGNDQLEYLIDSCLFSNMNLIRVWGGGYYESDEFYELCDKKGLLVWQDFCFACQPYPFFREDFLKNVLGEVKYNVNRLKHHACLAVWCGNNELEVMSMAWRHYAKYVKWTEKFFYHILPDELRKFDDVTEYIPGSPCGIDHLNGFDRDNVGDTHLWAVWHGLQPMKYYRKRMTRFCSEFGFESLPDIKAIEKFAEKKDYDIHSPVFMAHQKCASGNDKMLYYIATRFRLPKKFEDLIYLSQVTQQECVSDATEHWRRNKGRCNGSVYWQLNDCWGVCSWASLDYYGNYKALQYTARRFNAPVSVSIEDTDESVKIFVINDKNYAVNASVRYSIFDFESGIREEHEKELTVDRVKNEIAFELSMKEIASKYDVKKTGLKAELYINGEAVNEKTLLFKPEKELDLPDARLTLNAERKGDFIEVSVSADKFARLVWIANGKSTLPFSDNCFDLLPGETKTVTMPADKALESGEQESSFTAVCANRIEAKASPAYDAKERARIFLQPVNIGQWIYYKNIPGDKKI